MANSPHVADTFGVRALIVLVLLAGYARADMLVIEEPGMYYACPKGKKWDDVEACLKKHGKPALVRAIAGAKLVRLDQLENKEWVDGGLYLYTEGKNDWHISGTFFGRGTEYDILEFEPMHAGKAPGFRIEIGQASPLWVQLDGVTTTPAVRRAYQTMLCSPQTSQCYTITKSCEVLVKGRAYWTFRGSMTIQDNQVDVPGDRRLAGPFCTQGEKLFLGWPQT